MSYAVMRECMVSGKCQLFEALAYDSQNREYWTYPGDHATTFNEKAAAQEVAERLNESYGGNACYVVSDMNTFLFIVRDPEDRKVFAQEESLPSTDNIFTIAHSIMDAARLLSPNIECCEVWYKTDKNHMNLLVTAF